MDCGAVASRHQLAGRRGFSRQGPATATVAGDLDLELAGVRCEPFDLALEGVGAFGEGADIHTIWAGVAENAALRRLAKACETAARRVVLSYPRVDVEGREVGWDEAELRAVRARADRLEADVCRAAGVAPGDVRRLAWTGPALRAARARAQTAADEGDRP